MGKTTNLLITDTQALALSHFPTPNMSTSHGKQSKGSLNIYNHTVIDESTEKLNVHEASYNKSFTQI